MFSVIGATTLAACAANVDDTSTSGTESYVLATPCLLRPSSVTPAPTHNLERPPATFGCTAPEYYEVPATVTNYTGAPPVCSSTGEYFSICTDTVALSTWLDHTNAAAKAAAVAAGTRTATLYHRNYTVNNAYLAGVSLPRAYIFWSQQSFRIDGDWFEEPHCPGGCMTTAAPLP